MVLLNSRNTFSVLTAILLFDQVQTLPVNFPEGSIGVQQQQQASKRDGGQEQHLSFHSGLPRDNFGLKRSEEKRNENENQIVPNEFGRLQGHQTSKAFTEKELSSLHLRKREKKDDDVEMSKRTTNTTTTITKKPLTDTTVDYDTAAELSNDGTSLVADNLYPLRKRRQKRDIGATKGEKMVIRDVKPVQVIKEKFAKCTNKGNNTNDGQTANSCSSSDDSDAGGNVVYTIKTGNVPRKRLFKQDIVKRANGNADESDDGGNTSNPHWSSGDSDAGQGTYWKGNQGGGGTYWKSNQQPSNGQQPGQYNSQQQQQQEKQPQPQPQPQHYQNQNTNQFWSKKQKRSNPYWHPGDPSTGQGKYWVGHHDHNGQQQPKEQSPDSVGGDNPITQITTPQQTNPIQNSFNQVPNGQQGVQMNNAATIGDKMGAQSNINTIGGEGTDVQKRSFVDPFRLIKRDQEIRSNYTNKKQLTKRQPKPEPEPNPNRYWHKNGDHSDWSSEHSEGLGRYWKKNKKRGIGKVKEAEEEVKIGDDQYVTAIETDASATDLDKKSFQSKLDDKNPNDNDNDDGHDSCLENEKKGIVPQGSCEAQRMSNLLAGSIRKREEDSEQAIAVANNSTNQTQTATPPPAIPQKQSPESEAIAKLEDLQSKRKDLVNQQKDVETEIHELYKQYPILSATIQL